MDKVQPHVFKGISQFFFFFFNFKNFYSSSVLVVVYISILRRIFKSSIDVLSGYLCIVTRISTRESSQQIVKMMLLCVEFYHFYHWRIRGEHRAGLYKT